MFNKLKEHLKAMFEGNRCRFNKGCEHYRLDSKCCNNWDIRFPDIIGSYCGTYRWFDSGWYPIPPEDEGGYIVPKIWIEAVKPGIDSITVAKGKK